MFSYYTNVNYVHIFITEKKMSIFSYLLANLFIPFPCFQILGKPILPGYE